MKQLLTLTIRTVTWYNSYVVVRINMIPPDTEGHLTYSLVLWSAVVPFCRWLCWNWSRFVFGEWLKGPKENESHHCAQMKLVHYLLFLSVGSELIDRTNPQEQTGVEGLYSLFTAVCCPLRPALGCQVSRSEKGQQCFAFRPSLFCTLKEQLQGPCV